MSFKNYYKEIVINFQTERSDDPSNLEITIKDNQQQQQKHEGQSQNIQISSNSLPTKNSPISKQKIDDSQNSPFSFSQKQHNKTQSLAKNMSQSSLNQLKNQQANFSEVLEGLNKQNMQSQSQKSLITKQNNNNELPPQAQSKKSAQKNDKFQQDQQNTYQFQFQQRQERVKEDFDLNSQEYKKDVVEINKKKPSPIKLSPTQKPRINMQINNKVSDFNQNTQNSGSKQQKNNNNYYQQFETFSAKNESLEFSNKNSDISDNSQDNIREQRLINLQKKYIENFDNENNQINIDKLTVTSSLSSNLRLSDQNIQGKYSFQKTIQNQVESPQKFQDSSIDTSRNTIKTQGIANNSKFNDPVSSLHEKSTCRNNYKENQEDFIQFNEDFNHIDQQNKPSGNKSQTEKSSSDQQNNKGQKSSEELSNLKTQQYQNQNSFQDKYAEKENNNKNIKGKTQQKKYNQMNEQIDQLNAQKETLKAYESLKLNDLQIFINENILLQQELSFARQNLKETIEHYERQSDYYKDEIERLKQHLKIQELNQQDLNIQNELRNQELLLHQQLEIEAHKQGKNEQLSHIIKKIQQIDIQTEIMFLHKLEQERREKEEVIEKNIILSQQIQDLQSSLDYCRDYFRTSQDAQMKEKIELNQSIRIELEAKNQQILEERRQHKLQLNLINEEIKRQTEEHQKYIEQTEQQISNIETFYKKQLDDFKRTYEISIQKTKCITDEFDRLMQESNKNKELLSNCQKQLKNCEIRNSQLTDKNVQFNNKIVEINNILIEREYEKDAMLKEINQQAQNIEEKEIIIDRLSKEEEEYKKLQFSFNVEGKRIQELQDQIDHLGTTCTNQAEEIEQLKINLDQKLQENKAIKEEFEAYLEKNSKMNDITIEFSKQKQNLEQQIIQLRLSNEGISAKNQLLEQQAQKLTLSHQNMQQQLEQKEEMLTKFTRKEEKNNRKYQENIMILKSEIEQLQISDKQKAEENAKLKLKVKKIENESFVQLEEFKNQLESYYNNLIIKYQGDSNSETQKEQLQNEILSLKKKICSLESDWSLSILENQRLQRDLQEKNDEIEILFNRLKEIEILKSQLNLQLQEVEMQRKNEIEASQKIYE